MRTRVRAGFLVATIAALIVASTATAFAHYVYDEGYVWENGYGKCLYARSEISHGTGNGYSKATARAVKEIFNGWAYVECYENWIRPANYLRVKNQLQHWNGSSWVWCAETSLKYNTSSNDNLEQSKTWSLPCGKGYYWNFALGQTYFDNAWKGGWMSSSGSHYLPA
jgi:hypothetical protein